MILTYLICIPLGIIKALKHGKKFDDRYKRRIEVCINMKLEEKFWDDAKREMVIRELNKNQQKRLSPYLLSKKLLLR